jgi:hypothetical protein
MDYSYLNDFIGRNSELGLLKQAFNNQNVIFVSGMPGIGKTALVAKFLANQQENLLWLTDSNIQPLIKELEKCPTEPIEGQKTIFVLDDSQLREQNKVSTFVHYAKKHFRHSKLIVITRQKPDLISNELTDLYIKPIGKLNDKTSQKLIKQLYQKLIGQKPDPSTLEKLYSFLDGHPSAIKTFFRIIAQGFYSIEELLNEPSYFYETLNNLLFNQIFKSLSPEQIKTLELVSFKTGVITKKNLDSLGIQQQDILSLLNFFLIEIDSSNHSICINSVLKECIKETTPKSKHKAIHQKLANLYTGLESLTKEQYSCVFFHLTQAEDTESLARLTLSQIQQKLNLGETYTYLDTNLLKELAYKPSTHQNNLLFYLCEHYLAQRDFATAKNDAIAHITDPQLTKLCLARFHQIKCEFLKSEKLYLECLNKNLDLDKEVILHFSYFHILCILQKPDEAEKIIGSLERKLKVIPEAMQIRLNIIWGTLFFRMHRFQDSIEKLTIAESYFELNNDIAELEEIQFYIIGNLIKLKDYDSALKYLEKNKKLNQKINNPTLWFYHHIRYSDTYALKHDYKKALYKARLALKAAKDINSPFEQITTLRSICKYLIILKEYDKAFKYINQSIEISGTLENQMEQVISLLYRASFHLLSSKTENAEPDLLKASEIIESNHEFIKEDNRAACMLFYNLLMSDFSKQKHNMDAFSLYENRYESLKNSVDPNQYKLYQHQYQWYLTKRETRYDYIARLNEGSKQVQNEIELQNLINNKNKFQLFLFENQLTFHNRTIDFSKFPTQLQLLKILSSEPNKIWNGVELAKELFNLVHPMEKDRIHLRVQIHKFRTNLKDKSIVLTSKKGFQLNPALMYCLIFN